VDAARSPLVVALELTGSEEKGQVLVIIKSPYSMRTSRLEHVHKLYLPHQYHVLLEHNVDGADKVLLSESANLAHAENEDYKVEFVASPIVYSFVRSERFL